MNGKQDAIQIKCEEFSYVDTAGNDLSKVKSKVVMRKNITAPIKKGDMVGEIEYSLNGKKIGTANITSQETVKKADYKYEFVRLIGLMFQIN